MTRTGNSVSRFHRGAAARRRHPLARYAVLLLALALIGGVYAVIAPGGDRAEANSAVSTKAADDVAAGKKLFEASCASCHGLNGEGTPQAPTLVGVGAAAVDFQMSTGRMPAANPGAQMPRKNVPAWVNADTIRQVSAYVDSLGGGPAVPSRDMVDPAKGNQARGGELFRANCIQCHNWVGAGGALTRGKYAPNLNEATPEQIYEAMVTGPQAMPVFNDTTITPEQKRDMIAYIVGVREQTDPGGFGLGRIGPVTEGLAAWLVGIVLLVLAAMWITAKRKQHD
ncbi:c-type cytochrome [Bailinhaonella thermotolerans]|uniref:Cytochrome bc1 complex cytochrome c subunit n=1 Tax=Bailinhaonella thermotolerans TaxID=1070861 RepID=A0A3A4BJL2_9ACTN|nr:c-type cytochrome [Bailinhaonella thermotolerans]RJL31422.1 cytochrome C [Bailinhaonella thermotolerans]